jgi:hypothetical protein
MIAIRDLSVANSGAIGVGSMSACLIKIALRAGEDCARQRNGKANEGEAGKRM